jgi:hypothetical protein
VTDDTPNAQAILDSALSAVKPSVIAQIPALQASFVKLYGWFAGDADLLGDAFGVACRAKLAILEAGTQPQALEAKQTYALALDALERLGLANLVVGETAAGPFLRQAAHFLVTALAAGAGAAVAAVISIYVPIVGPILGPTCGAGVKMVIEELAP